jgi:predicted transcriptional regulator
MANNPSEKLLSDIDAFLDETGMGPSYFSKAASGNSELVKRLRGGGRFWPETEKKVRDFMRNHRKAASRGSAA